MSFQENIKPHNHNFWYVNQKSFKPLEKAEQMQHSLIQEESQAHCLRSIENPHSQIMALPKVTSEKTSVPRACAQNSQWPTVAYALIEAGERRTWPTHSGRSGEWAVHGCHWKSTKYSRNGQGHSGVHIYMCAVMQTPKEYEKTTVLFRVFQWNKVNSTNT